MSVPEAN